MDVTPLGGSQVAWLAAVPKRKTRVDTVQAVAASYFEYISGHNLLFPAVSSDSYQYDPAPWFLVVPCSHGLTPS